MRVNHLWPLVLSLLMLASCASPLPKYPAMPPVEALEVMRARDARVRTLQSECSLSLRDAAGSSVSLDGAIVAKWPAHLRLRAWKFGRPVFDLTYTPEGLWVYLPEETAQRGMKLEVTGEQFGRVWNLLCPGATDGAVVVIEADSTFTISRPVDPANPDHGRLVFEVDRETLTVRRGLVDSSAGVRQTLTLDSYREVGMGPESFVWPRRFRAEGDTGRIEVRLRDPEFNVEPAEGAFTPPRRAVKQP